MDVHTLEHTSTIEGDGVLNMDELWKYHTGGSSQIIYPRLISIHASERPSWLGKVGCLTITITGGGTSLRLGSQAEKKERER